MNSGNSGNSGNSAKSAGLEKTAAPGEDSESVLLLLREDHKRVRELFADFKKLKESTGDQAAAKAELVQQVCKELLIHAQVEEEIFYPAVRAGIKDQDLMDEAAVEHAVAKDLIEQLMEMRPGDALFDAKVSVLAESVEHHIREEEGDMFTQAQQSSVLGQVLAEQVFQRKQELLAEMDLPKSGKDKPKRSSGKKPRGGHAVLH